MRRVEAMLRKHTWLRQVCVASIFLYWIVGVTGFAKGVYLQAKKEAKTLASRTPQETQRLEDSVTQVAEEKLARAKRLGTGYSPKMYFSDCADIDRMEKKLLVKHGQSVTLLVKMSDLMQANVKAGYFYDSDVSVAAESYRLGIHDPEREEFKAELRQIGLSGVLRGLSLFYVKSIGLWLLLFLFRMVERRGVLETVLADKKKFFLALIAWPYFIFKYPHNVIREVIVEAELRRIGGLFRRLTLGEKLWVRETASRSDYASPKLAERGLLLALAVTIFLWLCPVLCFRTSRCLASTGETRQVTMQAEARAGPMTIMGFESPPSDSGCQAILEVEFDLEMPPIWTAVREMTDAIRQFMAKSVEHVPLCTAWHSTQSPSSRRVASPTNRRREPCSLSSPCLPPQSSLGIPLT